MLGLILLVIGLIEAQLLNQAIPLETTKGTVLGEVVESSGTWGQVFESIPFAKPPSGELRFELPEPRDPWKGVLDVRNQSACYHYLRFSEKLPLLFWIHGGGFRVGGKYYYENSGILRNVASKRIVFASADYRMGFEGFVATRSNDMPGNLALEDVALALKFLRENADSMGFDVNNIIVAGESAGGTMAGIFGVSPRLKGEIHAAMLFSGFASGPLAISTDETAPKTCYDNKATVDYFFTPILDKFRCQMSFMPENTTTEMVK
ncbi:unnamed protein product, partial [Mesorhabditis belari]|uniref:Carboxylesterase type B domain-containing protein n=1 Tax=Mesorhabditis belari TaxID=2138241 RepID=A0AAF3EDQ9_9BILA